MKLPELENGFFAEFDNVKEDSWNEIISRFDDANIYQTWSYDAARYGERNFSHFILKTFHGIVSVAQVRITKLPLSSIGAAYIRWGPLCLLRGQKIDPCVFRMAIRALRNEYVFRRGLLLRILPVLYDKAHAEFKDILIAEKFTPTPGETPQRTLILDIQPAMGEIRKNFDQKWRNCLNKAEKSQLDILEGTDDFLFKEFIELYRELLNRKKFREPNDINEFRAIQRSLPDMYKMRIFIAREDGRNSSGSIVTAIGITGIYLFGATNVAGMKTSGSYLLQWKMIQWMKNNGCNYYNLNGINPKMNPGSYHFKSGISGKTGSDVHYLGRFDSYSGSLTPTTIHIVNLCFKLISKKLRNLRNHH